MKKNNLYMITNIIVIFAAMFFLFRVADNFTDLNLSYSENSEYYFLLVVIMFLLAHVFKSSRFYLILFETRIGTKDFIKLYIKTTFVNILLPFKIGELFRIYTFGEKSKSYVTGFLSVLTDRYFDTCILLLIVIPINVIQGSFSYFSFILLGFIVLITFTYIIFKPTYRYLNEYIIINKSSNRSLKILGILERFKLLYDFEKSLLRGRYSIIIMLSVLAWITEFLMLYLLSKLIFKSFGLETLVQYIQSALFITDNFYLTIYTITGAVVFGFSIVIIFILTLLKKDLRENAEQ